ncbi:hypothetical protein AK812_SmicGene28694 [Symbiodinium microadriaticum]|uniref:Uncharacterized protein n=1 Tax=Symbiodinium microadriaticum TaxID=2951 RepID=A0A1Q9D3Q3_SYMMI|nr:hypothetical protein AK812_SmicGene28694 [Symbiodinium microadriaticum]
MCLRTLPRLGFMPDCIQWNTEPEGLGTVRMLFEGKLEFLAMRFSDVSVMCGLLAEKGDESKTGLEACLNVAKSLTPEKMEKVRANKLLMYKAVLTPGKMLLLPPGYMLGVRAHGENPHGIASLRAHVLPTVKTAVRTRSTRFQDVVIVCVMIRLMYDSVPVNVLWLLTRL